MMAATFRLSSLFSIKIRMPSNLPTWSSSRFFKHEIFFFLLVFCQHLCAPVVRTEISNLSLIQ